jgi:hypothetical protein
LERTAVSFLAEGMNFLNGKTVTAFLNGLIRALRLLNFAAATSLAIA